MSRYAAAHASPQGPGDARPTALQIVKYEHMDGRLAGKVIVITGTSSGIGIETYRALLLTGARFFLTARDISKARAALKNVLDPSRTELVEMDQSSLASVRAAAQSILAKVDKINILVANAGVIAVQTLELTKDGHEMQFGVNHLSHFLFFELLKPALLAGSTPEFNSRVVVVSSSAHLPSGINASDSYSYQKGGYNPGRSYSQSKTANIYMANEIDRRYGSQGLHALSLHPGAILTNLSRHMPKEQLEALGVDEKFGMILKNPEQGAATTVWAAIGKHWEGKGGRYLSDCSEAKASEDDSEVIYNTGYAKHAYDPDLEGRLWQDSLKLVGLA